MLIILIWREPMRKSTKNLDLQIAEKVLRTPQMKSKTHSKPIPEQQFQENEDNKPKIMEYQPHLQNSNDDYLFGDDNEPAVEGTRHKMQVNNVQSINQRSQQSGSQQNQREILLPVRRSRSTALNEVNAVDEMQRKKKTKYKKQENMGNILCEQKHVDNIFKHLCEPSGKITVNSLGHALQKYKIHFEVRDVVEMMQLYYTANNIEIPQTKEGEEEVVQDQIGELNMSVILNEVQFKELYKLARKKR